MRPSSSHKSICRGIRVAGTPAIAAPGTSYAVDFSQLLEKAELLPPAADCATGKIAEHREDESSELRRKAVHGRGAAPGLTFRTLCALSLPCREMRYS